MSYRYEIFCDRAGCNAHQVAAKEGPGRIPDGWTVDNDGALCQTCSRRWKTLISKHNQEQMAFWRDK